MFCFYFTHIFFTGVTNFNGNHGCLKCTVIGEYSHKSNTVTFPKFDCPKRNDEDFRAKKYEEHHKHVEIKHRYDRGFSCGRLVTLNRSWLDEAIVDWMA